MNDHSTRVQQVYLILMAAIQVVAVPLMWLARRGRAESDPIPAEDR